MRLKRVKTFLIFFILCLAVHSSMVFAKDDLYPSVLLQLDDTFSHHVLVAEKSTHNLYLYENNKGEPKLIKRFQMATGKKAGNKIFQGDFRTPEGVYFFTSFIPHEKLIEKYGKEGEIYGVGSFVMDYPNPIDRLRGKTGGGIWLHSTNDETRIDKGLDSRGCLVTANNDLKEISEYIELNKTSVVVVHNLTFLSKQTWEKERGQIKNMVYDWLEAWQNENLKEYIGNYSKEEFVDRYRGDYNKFRAYKRAVFNNPGKPEINIDDLSIVSVGDYAVVTFKQVYSSKRINDTGKKSLYLRKDPYYKWKIVSENWSKAGMTNPDEHVAFQPSMRFFKKGEEKKSNN